MTLNEDTIRELLDASTPGPWEWWGRDLDGPNLSSVLDIQVECGAYCAGGMATLNATPNNKKLIALAPELAAEVLRLYKALSAWIEDERAAETALKNAYGLGDTTTTHTTIINRINSILEGEHNA